MIFGWQLYSHFRPTSDVQALQSYFGHSPVENRKGDRGMSFNLSAPQLISISFDGSTCVARTSGAAFLEIALLVAVSVFVGMNDETAAVFIKQGETAR